MNTASTTTMEMPTYSGRRDLRNDIAHLRDWIARLSELCAYVQMAAKSADDAKLAIPNEPYDDREYAAVHSDSFSHLIQGWDAIKRAFAIMDEADYRDWDSDIDEAEENIRETLAILGTTQPLAGANPPTPAG